ncbi:MAG: phage holin family protein [Patescibacteria group bacterium]
MKWLLKVIVKVAINAGALIALARFFSDFIIQDDFVSIAIAATILTALNVFVRPLLKIVTFPLILLTFGLFNIVLHVIILYVATLITPTTLTIESISTLFWSALILGILNSII